MDESSDRFARLYDEHIWMIYGYFGYGLRFREDAGLLTRQTFERAYEAWNHFDEGQASAVYWLLTIARNVLIDHHQADTSDRFGPIGHDGPPLDAHTQGFDPELEAALGRLSDRDREVLALRFGADLTCSDIAELTGLGPADVQKILSTSLRRLRGELHAPARQ